MKCFAYFSRLCWILIVLATFRFSAHAAPAHYIFAVDTSTTMSEMKETLRNTAYDFIYSGLNGEMKDGDTFGLWIFNTTMNSAFPPSPWTWNERQVLAIDVYEYIKLQVFEQASRFEPLQEEISKELSRTAILNIFIFSDGSQPINGTPFDSQINETFRERSLSWRREGRPTITRLYARGGTIHSWSVTTVGARSTLNAVSETIARDDKERAILPRLVETKAEPLTLTNLVQPLPLIQIPLVAAKVETEHPEMEPSAPVQDTHLIVGSHTPSPRTNPSPSTPLAATNQPRKSPVVRESLVATAPASQSSPADLDRVADTAEKSARKVSAPKLVAGGLRPDDYAPVASVTTTNSVSALGLATDFAPLQKTPLVAARDHAIRWEFLLIGGICSFFAFLVLWSVSRRSKTSPQSLITRSLDR